MEAAQDLLAEIYKKEAVVIHELVQYCTKERLVTLSPSNPVESQTAVFIAAVLTVKSSSGVRMTATEVVDAAFRLLSDRLMADW